jgi:hypothetical protein
MDRAKEDHKKRKEEHKRREADVKERINPEEFLRLLRSSLRFLWWNGFSH